MGTHALRLVLLPVLAAVLVFIAIDLTGCTLASFANFNTNGSNNNNSSNSNGGSSGISLNFSTPVNISNSHLNSRSATALERNYLIDQNNTLYLAYEEDDSANGNVQINYSSKTSTGSWSTPRTVSAGTSSDPVAVGTVRIAVSNSTGKVFIVWQQGSTAGNQSRIVYTTNVSGDFISPTTLSTSSGQPAVNPGIRVDANDDAHVLWTVNQAPRSIVYKGIFGGTPDSTESAVSAQSGRLSDDAVLDPDAIGLVPGSGSQIVALPYIAIVNNIPVVLYTERPAGSGQTFGSSSGIVDISVEQTGGHTTSSTTALPRIAFDSVGDLQVMWVYTSNASVRNIAGNSRASGSTFAANSKLLTTASTGDSGSTTPPVDTNGFPLLDSAGGLHVVYEDRSTSTNGTYSHRYFSLGSSTSDPTVSTLDLTTEINLPHQLRSVLDPFFDLYTAFPVEDSVGNRIIFSQHRTSGASGAFDGNSLLMSETGFDSRLASVHVSSTGRAFVLFDTGTPPVVKISARETTGRRSGPQTVSNDSSQTNTAVGVRVDSAGTAHVIWLDTFNSVQKDVLYSSGS